MRLIGSFALLLFLLSPSAWAQRSLGYWFLAPGALTAVGNSSFTLHMGGGGEIAIWKGISLGLEGGAVGRTDDYTRTVIGVGSVNGVYHFFHSRDARWDPFVTVGYSLLFRHGTANAVNYGGGLNYWFTPGLAARFEIRDHVYNSNPKIHYWGARFGMSFSELLP